MKCNQCGKDISENSVFCPVCGTKQVTGATQVQRDEKDRGREDSNAELDESVKKVMEKGAETTGKVLGQFTEKINHLAGGEGEVKLRVKDLFLDVFKKHDSQQAEEIFICGTDKTTPTKEKITTEWPKPWLYTRVAFYMLIAFIFLVLCFTQFSNTKALPGVMFIGSMIVPFSVLIFFFEVNAPRNISIFDTAKIFFVGGCASLFVTLILYGIVPIYEMDYFGAILVGIIEEIGKLLVVAFYIKRNNKSQYLLNGLLIGAAVGAGFAAFESAGYAFEILLGYSYENMMANIILRGILAPGGHVAWTAIAGFAIVLVKKNRPFKWDMLLEKEFLSIFILPVIMHAVWDMPFEIGNALFPIKEIVLIVVAWIIILVFIHSGLNEINIQKDDTTRGSLGER